jgi:hypothetical protein
MSRPPSPTSRPYSPGTTDLVEIGRHHPSGSLYEPRAR